jgi:glycosyltransferase involved in cell wall biosynthesis
MRQLAIKLKSFGHKVFFAAGELEPESRPETDQDRIGVEKIFRLKALTGGAGNYGLDPKYYQELNEFLCKLQPDVILANSVSALIMEEAAHPLSIPVVYRYNGPRLLCPMKRVLMRPDGSLCNNEKSYENCQACQRMYSDKNIGQHNPLKFLRRLLDYRNVNKNVSQFLSIQSTLENLSGRILLSSKWNEFLPDSKNHIIRNGVDLDFFSPKTNTSFSKNYKIDSPFLFMPSRITRTKGHSWAIRSLAELNKSVKLVIAGGNFSTLSGVADPKEQAKKQYIDELFDLAERHGVKDRLIFVGLLDGDDLVDAYNECIATLVLSITYDNHPNVACEALSSGSPLIISENVGNSTLVETDESGIVVERNNQKSLVEAINFALANNKQMKKFARQNAVKNLDWNIIARQYEQVFYDCNTQAD